MVQWVLVSPRRREHRQKNDNSVADSKKETNPRPRFTCSKRWLIELVSGLPETRAQVDACKILLAQAEDGIQIAESQHAASVIRIAKLEKNDLETDAKLVGRSRMRKKPKVTLSSVCLKRKLSSHSFVS